MIPNLIELDTVKKYFNDVLATIDSLKKMLESKDKEIERLKSENYKDSELSEMKKHVEAIKKNYAHCMPLSEDEWTDIEDWQDKHLKEVHGVKTEDDYIEFAASTGGVFEYDFIPNSLGILRIYKCGKCGEEFDFSDMGF